MGNRQSIGRETKHSTDEVPWVRDKLMPLLRRIGFRKVNFTHGVLEAGRDVVFSDFDRFGLVKCYAAQAKDGDLKSRSDTQEIRLILDQLHNAYETPCRDVATGTEHRIAGVYLIVNGTVSDAAKQILYSKTGSWMNIVDQSQLDVADMLMPHLPDMDRGIAYGFLQLEIERNKKLLDSTFACDDNPEVADGQGSEQGLRIPCGLLSTRWLDRGLDIILHEVHPSDVDFWLLVHRWSEVINFLLIKIPLGATSGIEPSFKALHENVSEYRKFAPVAVEAIEFILNNERPRPGERLDASPSIQQFVSDMSSKSMTERSQ